MNIREEEVNISLLIARENEPVAKVRSKHHYRVHSQHVKYTMMIFPVCLSLSDLCHFLDIFYFIDSSVVSTFSLLLPFRKGSLIREFGRGHYSHFTDFHIFEFHQISTSFPACRDHHFFFFLFIRTVILTEFL